VDVSHPNVNSGISANSLCHTEHSFSRVGIIDLNWNTVLRKGLKWVWRVR